MDADGATFRALCARKSASALQPGGRLGGAVGLGSARCQAWTRSPRARPRRAAGRASPRAPGPPGRSTPEPEPGALGVAGARGLVVGVARHRHEQRRAPRARSARGRRCSRRRRPRRRRRRSSGSSGRWRAARRRPRGTDVGGGERRRQRRDLDPVSAVEVRERAPGRLAHLLPLPERDEHVAPPRGRARARPRPRSRGSSSERSSSTIGPTRWARSRSATVGPASSDSASSPGSSTASKAPARPSGTRLEPRFHSGRRHQTAVPACGQRAEQRLVGVGAVEDDHVRLGLGDHGPQPRPQAPRPAVVVARRRGRVGGDVLDREAHLLDHRRRRREGQEQRLDPVAEPAGDRHRAGQVAEPGAVRGGEEDPAPGAPGCSMAVRGQRALVGAAQDRRAVVALGLEPLERRARRAR